MNLALGLGDYYDIGALFSDERASADYYYRLLNAGFRIAATGGTDKLIVPGAVTFVAASAISPPGPRPSTSNRETIGPDVKYVRPLLIASNQFAIVKGPVRRA